MEEGLKEDIELELDIGREEFESAMSNLTMRRYRSATSDLHFSLEHFAKALLLTVGVEAQSHQGILNLLGRHFIKPGRLPVQVGRWMGNLYERRITAEYSRRAGWEFNAEELDTFTEWYGATATAILGEAERMAPDLREPIRAVSAGIEGALKAAGEPIPDSDPRGD